MSTDMTTVDAITCPLCDGRGNLPRAEVLDRVGAKDFKQIATLTAEEMMRRTLDRSELEDRRRQEWYQAELERHLEAERSRSQSQLEKMTVEKHGLEAKYLALEQQFKDSVKTSADQARLAVETVKAKELAAVETQKAKELAAAGARAAELTAMLALAEKEKEVLKKEAAMAATDVLRSEHDQRMARLNEEIAVLKAQIDVSQKSADVELSSAVNNLEIETKRERLRADEATSKLQDRERELQDLKTRLDRVSATKGRVEEMDFEQEVRAWPELDLSDKQKKDGDYLLWLRTRDANGNLLRVPNAFVVDNKDDKCTSKYIEDIVKAADRRSLPMGILVFKDECQLRSEDRIRRWTKESGIWLLKTTRAWFRRDIEVLRPILERLAQEGPGYLEQQAHLATEIVKTLAELDNITKHLENAKKSLDSIESIVVGHRKRLAELCKDTMAQAGKHSDEAKEDVPLV